MRTLPILIGSVYAMLALFFIRFAIIFSQDTVKNLSSLFLIVMATMNFGLFLRVIFTCLKNDEANLG